MKIFRERGNGTDGGGGDGKSNSARPTSVSEGVTTMSWRYTTSAAAYPMIYMFDKINQKVFFIFYLLGASHAKCDDKRQRRDI